MFREKFRDINKKAFAVLLCFMLLLTAIPVHVLAAGIKDGDSSKDRTKHSAAIYKVWWKIDISDKHLYMHLEGVTGKNAGKKFDGTGCIGKDGAIISDGAYHDKAGRSLLELLKLYRVSDAEINAKLDFSNVRKTNGCYARWKIDTAHGKAGEYAITVYPSDFETGGSYTVWADTNGDGGIDGTDWHQTISDIKETNWAGEGKRYIGLPAIPDNLKDVADGWTLKWYSGEGSLATPTWQLYTGTAPHVSDAWSTPLAHSHITPEQVFDPQAGVSPSDDIKKTVAKEAKNYNIAFALHYKNIFQVDYDLAGGAGNFPMQTAMLPKADTKTNTDTDSEYAKITTHNGKPTKTGSTFLGWRVKADFDCGDGQNYKTGQDIAYNPPETVHSKNAGILHLIAKWDTTPEINGSGHYSEIDFFGDGATEGHVDTIIPGYDQSTELPQDSGDGSQFDRILRSDEYTNLSGSDVTSVPAKYPKEQKYYDEQSSAFDSWYWTETEKTGTKWSDFSSVAAITVTEIYPEPEDKQDKVEATGLYGGYSGPHEKNDSPHTEYDDYIYWDIVKNTVTYAPGTAGWVRWTFYDEQQIEDDYQAIADLYQEIKALKQERINARAKEYATSSDYQHDFGGWKTDYKWDNEKGKYVPDGRHWESDWRWVEYNHRTVNKFTDTWQSQINKKEAKIDSYKEAISWLKSHPYMKSGSDSHSCGNGVTASIGPAPTIDMHSRWKDLDNSGKEATTEFSESVSPTGCRTSHTPDSQLTAKGRVYDLPETAYHQMGWYDTATDGIRLTDNSSSFALGKGNAYRYNSINQGTPGNDDEIDKDTREEESTKLGEAVPVKGNDDNHYKWYAHWYSIIYYDTVSGLGKLFNGKALLTDEIFYDNVNVNIMNGGEHLIDQTTPGTTGVAVTLQDSGDEEGYVGDSDDSNFIDIVYRNDENTHLDNSPAGEADITRKPDVTYNGKSINGSVIFVGWNTRADGKGEWVSGDGIHECDGKIKYSGPDIRLYAQYRLSYGLSYNGNRQTKGDNIGYVTSTGKLIGFDTIATKDYVKSTGDDHLLVNDTETFTFRKNGAESSPENAFTHFERFELSELPFVGSDGLLHYRKVYPEYKSSDTIEGIFSSKTDEGVTGFGWYRNEMKLKDTMTSMEGIDKTNFYTKTQYPSSWGINSIWSPLEKPGMDNDIIRSDYVSEEWNDNESVWIPIRHPYKWMGWSLDIGPIEPVPIPVTDEDGNPVLDENGDPTYILNSNWDDDAYFMDGNGDILYTDADGKTYRSTAKYVNEAGEPCGANVYGGLNSYTASIVGFLVEAMMFNATKYGSGNIQVDPIDQTLGIVTFAVWDEAPDICSYYSVSVGEKDIKNATSVVTQTELIEKIKKDILTKVLVSDREDSDGINMYDGNLSFVRTTEVYSGNRHSSVPIVWVSDISYSELSKFIGKATGSVTVKVYAKDSAGNISERNVAIWINRSEEGDPDPGKENEGNYTAYRGTRVRQIDREAFSAISQTAFTLQTAIEPETNKMPDLTGTLFRANGLDIPDLTGDLALTTPDQGGLSKTSIWRMNSEYLDTLTNALNNDDSYIASFTITGEQRKNTRKYLKDHGNGNSRKNRDYAGSLDPILDWWNDSVKNETCFKMNYYNVRDPKTD